MTQNEKILKNELYKLLMAIAIIICFVGLFCYAFFDNSSIGMFGICCAAGVGICNTIVEWLL